MTVAKRTLLINDLRERVTLFNRKIVQNDDGNMEEIYDPITTVWAKIEAISGPAKITPDVWHEMESYKINGIFKIVMRKINDRIARHAYLYALGWNHKVLDILIPFQEQENKRWLEGIAVEYRKGGENG